MNTFLRMDYFLFTLFFITMSIWDALTLRIPDIINYGSFLYLIALAFLRNPEQASNIIFPALFSFTAMAAISLLSKNKLGMGDAKFSLTTGGLLGIYFWLISLIIAAVTALLLLLPPLLLGKMNRDTPIPFSPFLSLGALTALWLQESHYLAL